MDASYLQQELGLEDSHRIFSSKSGARLSLLSVIEFLVESVIASGARLFSFILNYNRCLP